ncbi:DUF4132 domain-containing protein [Actinomadura sp. B10D3]|uniref:DUF4132 domain-containing protein n=1 Tax=Actinomadura sp. B10D3 TaxID=3153557 RepID=UPI00325F25D2
MTENPRIEDAPESALPDLLVEPPWVRAPRSAEPAVLKLKAPKEPTTMRWPDGLREKWLDAPYDQRRVERLPDGTDWDQVAEDFATGRVEEHEKRRVTALAMGLIMQGPLELGERLLADERYWPLFFQPGLYHSVRGAAARHGMAAYPLLMHIAKNKPVFYGLDPFLDADVAQIMIKHFDVFPNRDQAAAWFEIHGEAAARLAVPDALRKPGPKRQRAEAALRLVARHHGDDAVREAARFYGDEAVEAISALRTDPLDMYPDPLPDVPEGFDPERLPRILLRDRRRALPASATRHLITMLSISDVWKPYPGVPQVVEHLDPASLAEFVWALYLADRDPKRWASPGVQYALINLGDDTTAERLAPIVARWSKAYVWDAGGSSALSLFTRLGTDTALRHLHRLARKAKDPARIQRFAQSGLDRIAEERGLTSEQLADRLVPDLGLDAGGTMTLDYGPRRFVVGFDEQLKPFVTDQDGKPRKTLPKPGVKDDQTLAPAAYKRFADLKKEARTVAADQIKRLERAMVTRRSWTPEEFGALLVEHPLMGHITRRLVWAAGDTAFRVAEDGTLADVHDDEYTLPPDAAVTLPHPVLLDEKTVAAWASVFADYEILQPFEQLRRPVHLLEDGERDGTRLTRFEGRTAHFGRFLGMTSRGWELGDKETGGFRRQVNLMTPDGRHVMVAIDPGIRVLSPEEYAEQTIQRVMLMTGRYSGTGHPFGALDPVTASEIIAELTRVTG